MTTNADRQKRYRERKRNATVTENTESVTKTRENVTEYPPIVYWLADEGQRKSLGAIHRELARHNVDGLVRFGVNGLTFESIGEILEGYPAG